MSSWVSPVLGWGSEMSCPRTLPRKNPEDPVWLEPRTPGLRVNHFTTEPRRTPGKDGEERGCTIAQCATMQSVKYKERENNYRALSVYHERKVQLLWFEYTKGSLKRYMCSKRERGGERERGDGERERKRERERERERCQVITLPKTKNFRLFQTERVSRRQFQI